MTKVIVAVCVGIAIGAAAVWFFLPQGGASHEPEKKEEAKSESRLVHTNDETWIRLDKKAQELAGLKIAEIQKASITPEIKAYGRVLDPAPLAALTIEIATARAALEASQKEYNRLKELHAQNQNVSARALETAEASWKRDEVAVQSAQLRLLASWGKTVAEMKDLPALVRSLASLESSLVRLEVPFGESIDKIPTGARIAPLQDEAHAFPARLLGPASTVDPQSQARGFLFLMETNALPLGASVVGWLAIPGENEEGVIVPASALIRHEGEVFVFLQRADDLFSRTGVELERPVDKGWLAKGELKAGEKIVVTGGQQLLSEELKAQSSEE
jgi:hypothetical protein